MDKYNFTLKMTGTAKNLKEALKEALQTTLKDLETRSVDLSRINLISQTATVEKNMTKLPPRLYLRLLSGLSKLKISLKRN